MKLPQTLTSKLIEVHERERAAWAEERREWTRERAELLTRIQAPEQAPALAPTFDDDPLPTLPYDNDEAYWEERKRLNGDNG